MLFRATSIASFIMNGCAIFDRTVVHGNGTRVMYDVEDLFNEKFFVLPSTNASYTATELYDSYYIHKWLLLIYAQLVAKYRHRAIWKVLSIELLDLIKLNVRRVGKSKMCETVMDVHGSIYYIHAQMTEMEGHRIAMDTTSTYIGDIMKVKLQTTCDYSTSDSAVIQMAFDKATDPDQFIKSMQRHGMLKTALKIPLPKLLGEVRLLREDIEFMAMPYARFSSRFLKPIMDRVIKDKKLYEEIKLIINNPDLILESRSGKSG